MAKSGLYKFTSKKQSEKGIMSTILGFMSVVSFFTASSMSFRLKGGIPDRMGSVGFVSMLFAFVGAVLGCMSLREQDVFWLFPRMGTFLCVVALGLWVLVIMIGTGRI